MDLQIYGMRNVMEQATTHIAVDAMSGGKAAVISTKTVTTRRAATNAEIGRAHV